MHLLGKYPNLRSAMRPVPHSDDLPVPTPPVNKDLFSSSDEEMPSREDSAKTISLEDIASTYSGTSGNDLLASRLKPWNLVHQFQESEQRPCFLFRNGKQVVLLHKHTWLVYVPWCA